MGIIHRTPEVTWLLKKTSFLFYKLLLKPTCVLFVFEELVSEVVYQLLVHLGFPNLNQIYLFRL